MKIQIYERGKRRLCLCIPSWLAFNRVIAKYAVKQLNKTVNRALPSSMTVEVPPNTAVPSFTEQNALTDASMRKLFAELRKIAKKHSGTPFIEVTDKNGDHVAVEW